jgi:hypothetical protein
MPLPIESRRFVGNAHVFDKLREGGFIPDPIDIFAQGSIVHL